MNAKCIVVTILTVAMVNALGQAQGKAPSQSDRRISDLQKEVANLREQVGKLSKSLGELQGVTFKLRLDVNKYKDVELDLATPGKYQRLDETGGTGSFLISVEDAVPYLDGYKVHLNIGNPSAARYRGFKLKLQWAKAFTKFDDFAAWQEWDKAIKEKEVSFTETLMPGTWNKIEVIVSPAGVDELGYFHVSLETNTIALTPQP
jgi:hypothetical protein